MFEQSRFHCIYAYISKLNSSVIIPPQTVDFLVGGVRGWGEGVLFSRCPSFRNSVRQSHDWFPFNNLGIYEWILMDFYRNINTDKTQVSFEMGCYSLILTRVTVLDSI